MVLFAKSKLEILLARNLDLIEKDEFSWSRKKPLNKRRMAK